MKSYGAHKSARPFKEEAPMYYLPSIRIKRVGCHKNTVRDDALHMTILVPSNHNAL